MGRHIIVDIETTGFSRTDDDILEVACLTVENDLRTPVKGELWKYYYQGQRRSSSGAYNVHKISEEELKPYAPEFTNNIHKLCKTFMLSNFIGYYSNTFDIPFIKGYLRKHGYGNCEINNYIDLKDVYYKKYGKIKLTKLAESEGITNTQVLIVQEKLFPNLPVKVHAHSAAYDVTLTYLLLLNAQEKGYM